MGWLHVILELLLHGSRQWGAQRNANLTSVKLLKNSRVVAWVGVFLCALGLGSVGWGIWDISSGLSSGNWPKVVGTITESSTVEISQRYGTTTTHPVIEYKYEVNGQPYQSKRVSFSFISPLSRVDHYRPGMQVDVFYSPNNPSNAVLEPSMCAADCVMWGLATAFPLVMGLIILAMAANMRRRADRMRASEMPSLRR